MSRIIEDVVELWEKDVIRIKKLMIDYSKKGYECHGSVFMNFESTYQYRQFMIKYELKEESECQECQEL